MEPEVDTAVIRAPDLPPTSTHAPELNQLPINYGHAVKAIISRLPERPLDCKTLPWLGAPKIAIVCGSGLNLIKNILEGVEGKKGEDIVEVDYGDLEGFGTPSVQGHRPALAFGYLRSSPHDNLADLTKTSKSHEEYQRIPVICQLGRLHGYEGNPMSAVIYPMRVFKMLGVETVIITNAAGGLNPSLSVGSIMVLRDHLSLPSLTSFNPLIGSNNPTFGPRFPAMSDAYDFSLRKMMFRAAHLLKFKQRKIDIQEGCYAWVAGPTYETRAEAKFIRESGADVVGMSTVPEVIAARHAGIRVVAMSLVTNKVVSSPHRDAKAEVEEEMAALARGESVLIKREGEKEGNEIPANHEEVLATSAMRAEDLRDLISKFVEIL